ncbi:MAG: hypothetical protein K2M97_01420 [Muribaculaceae bacterium]|nr:hypothetical protein [Muribaculaceae bacterium]
MKLKLMISGVLLALAGVQSAQAQQAASDKDEQPVPCLIVTLTSGSTECFRMSDVPVITFPGDAMLVKSSDSETEFKRTDVVDFKVGEAVVKDPSGLKDADSTQDFFFSYVGGIVTLGGNGVIGASVISASGTEVARVRAAAGGIVTIATDALPAGVYVVAPDGGSHRSVKIMKH